MGERVESTNCVSAMAPRSPEHPPAKRARSNSMVRPANQPQDAPVPSASARESVLAADGRIYEYESAANPVMADVPVLALSAQVHQTGPTRIIPFDLSKEINTPYVATSPNLLVGFVRIVGGESIDTQARATSQAFYVISGKGQSTCAEHGAIPWAQGDMVVLPKCPGAVTHTADEGTDSALYWATDEPLLRYLGVTPSEEIFAPTVIRREQMLSEVERISHEPGAEHRNRMGILLGNKTTDYVEKGGSGTLTLTPTLWSLLNVLPPKEAQRPHRHNSVALDLCVYAKPPKEGERSGVYTMMGPELDEATGQVKNGVRCDWGSGAVFCTPPGWWHSHHNETDEQAWVLPMQDAGLYTYQRTLDIRFAEAVAGREEVAKAAEGKYEVLYGAPPSADCGPYAEKTGDSP